MAELTETVHVNGSALESSNPNDTPPFDVLTEDIPRGDYPEPRAVRLGSHFAENGGVSRWKFDSLAIGTTGFGSTDLFSTSFADLTGFDGPGLNTGDLSVSGGELVVDLAADASAYVERLLPAGITDLYVRALIKFAAADVDTVGTDSNTTLTGIDANTEDYVTTPQGAAIPTAGGAQLDVENGPFSGAFLEIVGAGGDAEFIEGMWVTNLTFEYGFAGYNPVTAHYLLWVTSIGNDDDGIQSPIVADVYHTVDIHLQYAGGGDDGTGIDDPPAVFASGFRWIAGQAQNDTIIKDPNLSAAWKDAGFFVGVWGVTYNEANFARDGAALAAQANALDADFLIIDAEECLKNADPTDLIDGLSDFAGPKALTTFGAASNGFTQPIDYQAFLDAGYDILPQAYYSATSTADGQADYYRPDLCLEHADRAGIPRGRCHLMIDMCSSGHPTASEQVDLLADAGISEDFSVFMVECCALDDLDTLSDSFGGTPDESPFSFALPGLLTDNGGGISPGPGAPGVPGFPPEGEGPLPGPGDPGYSGGPVWSDTAGGGLESGDFHFYTAPGDGPGPGSGAGWTGGGDRPGGAYAPTLDSWRYVVTNLDTEIQTVLDHLATERTITYTLNAKCVMEGKVPSDNPEVNIPALDGEPFLSYSDRLLYCFRREGAPGNPWKIRAAGILDQLEDEAGSDSPLSHFTAYDAWGFLESRPIVTDNLVLPGRAGLTYRGVRADVIAKALVTNTILAHGEAFVDAENGTFEECDEISHNFQQGMSVAEGLTELCEHGYIDVIMAPVWDPIGRPGIVSEMNVYKNAGTRKHEAIMAWDKPSRSLVNISRLHDGTQLADRVLFFDKDASPVLPVQTDAAAVTKYHERWGIEFFPGKKIRSGILALAAAELVLRKAGKTSIVVTPTPTPLRAPYVFNEYFLGDCIPIYASSRLREPISELRRVHGIPLEIDDNGRETIRGLLLSDTTCTEDEE